LSPRRLRHVRMTAPSVWRQELLRRDPQLKVVVASGYAGDDPPEAFLEIGAKEFVKKPYGLRSLLGVIREVLDRDGNREAVKY